MSPTSSRTKRRVRKTPTRFYMFRAAALRRWLWAPSFATNWRFVLRMARSRDYSGWCLRHHMTEITVSEFEVVTVRVVVSALPAVKRDNQWSVCNQTTKGQHT